MRKKRGKRKARGGEVRPEIAASYGVSITMPAAEESLSPNEVAEILNVTGAAVKQWIYQRRLPAVKLGNGFWKVRKVDLESFLRNRESGGPRRILLAVNATE